MGEDEVLRTEENIERVRILLEEQPREVTCRRNTLDMTQLTFNLVTKDDLRWHPYKIHVIQKLEEADYERRARFCRWFYDQAHNNRFLSNLL